MKRRNHYIEKLGIQDNFELELLNDMIGEMKDESEIDGFLSLNNDLVNLKSWKRFDEKASWKKIESSIHITKKLNIIKYAAVIAILIFSSVSYFVFQNNSIDFRKQTVVSHILLDDGSNITLDKNSELDLKKDFNKSKRDVKFKGRGYFNIAKNKEKPFNIEVNGAKVSVLGTEFYLQEISNGFRVDLIEGKVSITDISGNNSIINSGESAIVTDKIERLILQKNQILATQNFGDLKFDNSTVNDIISELNRIYGREIIILDKDIKNIGTETVHTTIRNGSITDFLKFMEIVFDLNVINSKGQFIISSK
jgi:ferric-dicitrate binding protein FerR (iron transport regulator)